MLALPRALHLLSTSNRKKVDTYISVYLLVLSLDYGMDQVGLVGSMGQLDSHNIIWLLGVIRLSKKG